MNSVYFFWLIMASKKEKLYNRRMNICLFTPDEINKPLSLKDERAVHIIKILHKKEGDTFTAGIIDGKAGHALITKIEPKEETAPNGKTFKGGSLSFSFTPETDGKLLKPLSMIIGFPRPIQLKRLFRDMAGLGVQEIHLVKTELGEASYAESSLSTEENCRQLLIEGCVQAGGTHIPKVHFYDSVEQCLRSLKTSADFVSSSKICCDNKEPASSLPAFLKTESALASAFMAIGSERGWTDRERSVFKQNGFTLCGLGERILRTETAATVSASLLLSAMGAFE